MFELCIVFDCTIIFSIDMPSVFAQSIVNDKKAGLAKRCKRDLLYGFYDNVRRYNPLSRLSFVAHKHADAKMGEFQWLSNPPN